MNDKKTIKISKMNGVQIVTFKEVVINHFQFHKLTRHVGDSRIARSFYENNMRVFIQLPRLRTPEGIIKVGKKEFLTLEIDQENQLLNDFFLNMDEYLVKYVSDHSEEWFGKSYDVEGIEGTYKKTVKESVSKRKLSIRIRIPPEKRENIAVFDENRNRLNLVHLCPDAYLVTLVELEGLRFLRTQITPVWNLLQCKVVQESPSLDLTKYLMLDPETETEQTESELVPQSQSESQPETNPEAEFEDPQQETIEEEVSNQTQTSSEESDEESEEEENDMDQPETETETEINVDIRLGDLKVSDEIDEQFLNSIEEV
tara:strand:+ start:822 stop:1766 length:945 start_codon:yes stop_codon:yes gene_type:complete